MAELESRKRKPEAELGQGAPAPVRLHPNMGERYRNQVTGLIEALKEPGRHAGAAGLIRAACRPHRFLAGGREPETGYPRPPRRSGRNSRLGIRNWPKTASDNIGCGGTQLA